VVVAAGIFTLAWTDVQAQVKAGSQFLVNTYTTLDQQRPVIAVAKGGDFVAVWQSASQEGSNQGVFGQRYDRSGARRGAEFRVNTYTTGNQYLPQVAVSPAGSFVVVWNSLPQDGSNTGVFGQRFDAAGNSAGAEFRVNTYTTGYQGYPHVAMDARGNFIVVWDSVGQDGSQDGVFARRYDASGTALGTEFRVNTFTTGYQERADVEMRATGEAIVVWQSTQDGSLAGVYAQRYDAGGNPAGAEFRVNTYTTDYQIGPAVGMAADGRFVVVWESVFSSPNFVDIRGQRYGADGTPAGAEFAAVSATGSQFIYGLAVDGQGNFVVTWDHLGLDGSDWGVFSQRFSSAGAPRGAQFLVNTYTTGYQGFGIGAADEVGNFVVAWQDHTGLDGNGRGAFAQRFGGLFPAALGVDATGNQVWEPGETVAVAPTWRNLNGASQTLGGTLSGIAGPPGATYTILNGTASYGTVANNASAQCTNCYAVAVDDPSPRPAQHWDALALESITPDTQGQQKRWALHVGRSFTDVPAANPFYRFVETLLHFGITGGCGGTSYCPSSPTTREQMSVFVLIAREGAGYLPPACSPPNVFTDVPETSPFCRFIEELSNRGVVGGCGPGPTYCPTAAVTREQMAVFVLRTLDPALDPPACVPPNLYADVPESSPFCRWIEELTARGVVGGCGGGNYCPTGAVTREQMGVFLSGTFGLALYGL
jgi:hypothetical protein